MRTSPKDIRNVRLIPPDNQEYRSYCRKIIEQKRTNSASKTPDKKMFVGKWLEDIINSELSRHHKISNNRIIRWESLSPSGNIQRHYREIDGVMDVSNSSVSIFEVKGSLSKSSIKSGIDQINDTRNLLFKCYKNIYAALILVDCRSIDNEFGCAEPEEIEGLLLTHEFTTSQNFAKLQENFDIPKICIILDKISVDSFIEKFGHPYDDENSNE